MKSTQAMRDRVRELMSKEADDYDRAVECVLDDLEGLIVSAPEPLPADPFAQVWCAEIVAAKRIATDFFRWWWNKPGSNTDDGFDEWAAGPGAPLLVPPSAATTIEADAVTDQIDDMVAAWLEEDDNAVCDDAPRQYEGAFRRDCQRLIDAALASQSTATTTDASGIGEQIAAIRKRVKNARGAIESGQVVDKDVHGSLTKIIAMLDDLATPTPSDAMTDEPAGDTRQPFARYPALAVEIERMAGTGNVGSMVDWNRFLSALNAALATRPSPAPDAVEAFGEITGIGASYDRNADHWTLYTMPGANGFAHVPGFAPARIEWVIAALRAALSDSRNDRGVEAS